MDEDLANHFATQAYLDMDVLEAHPQEIVKGEWGVKIIMDATLLPDERKQTEKTLTEEALKQGIRPDDLAFQVAFPFEVT